MVHLVTYSIKNPKYIFHEDLQRQQNLKAVWLVMIIYWRLLLLTISVSATGLCGKYVCAGLKYQMFNIQRSNTGLLIFKAFKKFFSVISFPNKKMCPRTPPHTYWPDDQYLHCHSPYFSLRYTKCLQWDSSWRYHGCVLTWKPCLQPSQGHFLVGHTLYDDPEPWATFFCYSQMSYSTREENRQ